MSFRLLTQAAARLFFFFFNIFHCQQMWEEERYYWQEGKEKRGGRKTYPAVESVVMKGGSLSSTQRDSNQMPAFLQESVPDKSADLPLVGARHFDVHRHTHPLHVTVSMGQLQIFYASPRKLKKWSRYYAETQGITRPPRAVQTL